MSIAALTLRGVMSILWMMCQSKYGWPESKRTEEARKELLEKMRWALL